MKKEIKGRKRALHRDAILRATREVPALKLVSNIPRDELGTIPKPFTYADALAVIENVGHSVWRKWGYSKRLAALKQATQRGT